MQCMAFDIYGAPLKAQGMLMRPLGHSHEPLPHELTEIEGTIDMYIQPLDPGWVITWSQ